MAAPNPRRGTWAPYPESIRSREIFRGKHAHGARKIASFFANVLTRTNRNAEKMLRLERFAKIRWLPIRYWFYLREAMDLRVTVRDPHDSFKYAFIASSLQSYQRAKQFLTKEPDTINWLRSNIHSDDIFLDIGANIGTFSVFAGRHISDNGCVYSLEPHLPTAIQLIRNVTLNDLTDRVRVMSVAASPKAGLIPFKYKGWRTGTSGSQLAVPEGLEMDSHVGVEFKLARSIDDLIEAGEMKPPNLVKIDTDGLEIQILEGMRHLLSGPDKPRSVLVEIQKGLLDHQEKLMNSFGYHRVANHVMGKSKALYRAGKPLEELPSNAVFEPMNQAAA